MFQFAGFPSLPYLIQTGIHEVLSCGFPHSDICGSLCICHSPQLFAAYHVFLRLSVPRHPPSALSCLTSSSFARPPSVAASLRSFLKMISPEIFFFLSYFFSSFLPWIFVSRYSVFKVRLRPPSFLPAAPGLKWTRTTDLTLIRRAL